MTKPLPNVSKICASWGKDKYRNYLIGMNGRLDALQAAILRVKLRHLDAWSQARRVHAQYYNEAFRSFKGIQIPYTGPGNVHIYNQYVLRAPQRDTLQEYLNNIRLEMPLLSDPLASARMLCSSGAMLPAIFRNRKRLPRKQSLFRCILN